MCREGNIAWTKKGSDKFIRPNESVKEALARHDAANAPVSNAGGVKTALTIDSGSGPKPATKKQNQGRKRNRQWAEPSPESGPSNAEKQKAF